MANLVGLIDAYESGELDETETLELFSELIKSSLAWQLQGSYGRMAYNFIEGGYIDADGEIHWENLPEDCLL